ncbi:hypothetical protein [Amycolatopsis rubida]|uniref:Uncharacterized protein n=1 Tax=Amycolatopsis rubida TaxID=112413 RepID=A0A1I6AIG6_9PSEU|nr:hypothetical protein [Amycolatopsis rubida]SFQ68443.1 hypothetical protein SAMN05421854_11945 [Amycolatopsis rubida]
MAGQKRCFPTAWAPRYFAERTACFQRYSQDAGQYYTASGVEKPETPAMRKNHAA